MKKPNQDKKRYREMTVANIREHSFTDYVEVIFLESARFYKLLRKNPAFNETLTLLHNALTKGKPLKVGFTSIKSEIIDEVRE